MTRRTGGSIATESVAELRIVRTPPRSDAGLPHGRECGPPRARDRRPDPSSRSERSPTALRWLRGGRPRARPKTHASPLTSHPAPASAPRPLRRPFRDANLRFSTSRCSNTRRALGPNRRRREGPEPVRPKPHRMPSSLGGPMEAARPRGQRHRVRQTTPPRPRRSMRLASATRRRQPPEPPRWTPIARLAPRSAPLSTPRAPCLRRAG